MDLFDAKFVLALLCIPLSAVVGGTGLYVLVEHRWLWRGGLALCAGVLGFLWYWVGPFSPIDYSI